MSRVLLVGLGNPGAQYKRTRHNVGFRLLDRLASGVGLRFTVERRKTPSSETASGILEGRPVILLKPLTYMNRSGEAVASLVRYYDIGLHDVLVIHDDVDLSLGRLKFARGGGAGGHKGVLSVIEHVGGQGFPRLRIGIGRAEGQLPVESYVLAAFSSAEEEVLAEVIYRAIQGVGCFLEEGIESAMNRYNAVRGGGE